MGYRKLSAVAGAITAALAWSAQPSVGAPPVPAFSTEDFLNRLGVNTHLDGLTRDDPWNTNAAQVGSQLAYLGVRLDRDWAHSPATGQKWKAVQNAWSPYGRFWTSVDEAGPAYQWTVMGYEEAAYVAFPGLIYAMGGPNEEDNTYPQGQGATLPDSALVQRSFLLKSATGTYAPGGKPTFTPGTLGASFASKSARHLVLQKPTGEFVIADWSEQVMTGLEHADMDTIDFGRTFATAPVYDVENGTEPIQVLHDVSRCTLSLKASDTYLVVLDGGAKTGNPRR